MFLRTMRLTLCFILLATLLAALPAGVSAGDGPGSESPGTSSAVEAPAALPPTPTGEGQPQMAPAQAQAQELLAPDANDYLWIAGSSFKPRSSAIQYEYMGNGCITSLTGGSALNQSFTAPFRVPDGSVIRGVRYYYYDTSAEASSLWITSYNGAGNFIDHIQVNSVGAAGEGNIYGELPTPYTIDTAQRGFVLNWYPKVAGSTMRLCGARIFYDRGPSAASASVPYDGPAPSSDVETPDSPAAVYDYYFLAGSSFSRRDSATSYQYGSSGCVYSTGGSSLFTVDLNMPDAVRVLGARFYYYDNSASDTISFYLTDYDGLGAYRDVLTGSSTNGGFGSVYVAMGAGYDPYIVNQNLRSLNAIAIGADTSNAQLCGVRVFYDAAPAAASAAEPLAAGETADAGLAPAPTGAAVAPVDSVAAPFAVDALPAKSFAHDLQLPQGAVANGLRVYYHNRRAPDGYVETWNYTGSAANFLGETATTFRNGYNSTYKAFASPYTVNHVSASLGVVPWIVYNPTYQFCGVRVYYLQGTTPRYRFIAASAFHPRSSATSYVYQGRGCISVIQSNTYVPLLLR